MERPEFDDIKDYDESFTLGDLLDIYYGKKPVWAHAVSLLSVGGLFVLDKIQSVQIKYRRYVK